MAPPSITAVGLSKRYRAEGMAVGWLDALRDVSFDIGAGEGVGLIGRNGAGKSTLLRILSRVTRPSAGYADVHGRVGALLEVGTGFHPELTGRENAFLSGSILGMSRTEVRARFDEIVAFAEIEPFIDTPVKRYSSGMYARLGFAVAAHLRPSILIVDEVLAVGDLPFQAKCLARMHQLTADGTTVLFVSHNLLAIADLCERALVLADGRLAFDGAAREAIGVYRRAMLQRASPDDGSMPEKPVLVLVNGRLTGESVEIRGNQALQVDALVERGAGVPDREVILNLVVEAPDGRVVIHLRSDLAGARLSLHRGTSALRVMVDDLPLAPGSYWLSLRVVGLDPDEPLLLDSERIEINVAGDAPTEAIVLPVHRFEQSDRTPMSTPASITR